MNKLLTISELSKFLHISRSKAYSLAHKPNFPSINIGKNIRIFEEDLILWLKSQKNML